MNEAAGERPRTYAGSQWTACYWIRLNQDLSRLYRRRGQIEEADRIQKTLFPFVRPAGAPR
jgi:hypothetical protein